MQYLQLGYIWLHVSALNGHLKAKYKLIVIIPSSVGICCVLTVRNIQGYRKRWTGFETAIT